MLEPAANAGAAVSAARMNAQTAASRKQTRATESLIGGLRNGGVYSWWEDVIAGRTEAFDHGKLDQPACCATPGEHRDEVDGFGNERTRDSNDRLLHKLFEAPQGAQCGAGMNGADSARMAGAPGLEQIQRLGAAHLTHRYAVGAKPER